MAQHLGGSVTDKLQFVLICSRHTFQKGSEGMSAAVWGVLSSLHSIHFQHWVIYSAGVQYGVKC